MDLGPSGPDLGPGPGPELDNIWSNFSLNIVHLQGISEVVRVLLGSGCFSVDAGDESDKTPLHYAALNGADEVFQLLVENKADIDALDAVGATPLHFAVR
mgnify:CR=1 FL=1